jgi:hypothetical protein
MTIRWKEQRDPPWREGGREAWKADRAWSDAHPGHALIYFGRCRSGRRWFWAANCVCEDNGAYGWTETEEPALADMREAVERLAEGRDALAIRCEGTAASRLKEVNKTKRAARPAPNGSDAHVVEYLYGYTSGGEDFDGSPVRFRITKKTAKRIYYSRGYEYLDVGGQVVGNGPLEGYDYVGFVDRQKLEAEGEVYNRSRPWRADWHIYATFDGCVGPQDQTPVIDLTKLKAEMAAAHPDKGGSSAAFIEARKRYVDARRNHRKENRT